MDCICILLIVIIIFIMCRDDKQGFNNKWGKNWGTDHNAYSVVDWQPYYPYYTHYPYDIYNPYSNYASYETNVAVNLPSNDFLPIQ